MSEPRIGIDFQARSGGVSGARIKGGDIGIRVGGAPLDTHRPDFARLRDVDVDLSEPAPPETDDKDRPEGGPASKQHRWKAFWVQIAAAVIAGLILWTLIGS